MSKISSKWETVAVVGYSHAVSRLQNPAAHGGVCLLQARKYKGHIQGRKVNSNGRHQEVGETFLLDNNSLKHWENIRCST